MTQRGIKMALILGPIALAILGLCAFQRGLIRPSTVDTSVNQAGTSLTEGQLKAMLGDMSGNKGYDSWPPREQAMFKAEQLRVLESLRNK